MKNLKKLYYKDYYKRNSSQSIDFSFVLDDNGKASDSDVNEIAARNRELCEARLNIVIPRPALATHTLVFKVLYPGLVTGIGIAHEASVEGEFKLGMHFDHTYGLPIIYGSSVKGILRNYLKEVVDDETKIDELERSIFDGGKSIYDRDLFFDAVIVRGAANDGHLIASDSITPHKEGPLKNPIPITFMKIASGCQLEFRFRLLDSPLATAQQKLDWFKEILLTFGIGAKTNVGYGQLEFVE